MSEQTPTPAPELEELPASAAAAEPEAVPTTAIGAPAGAASGRRRRWVTALAIAGLLVGVTAVGAVLLAGAGADSTVARWAPPDALAYVEVRADMPGDQRAALGEFLSAFPGFADQASLDRKLNELYDRLVSAATDGDQTFTGDIGPWFDGQLGLAVGPLPAVESLVDPSSLAFDGRALAIATIDDAAAATAWVRASAAEAGLRVETGDADGTDLLLIGGADHPMAAAATDAVLLLGDEASVRAALARGGADGLATVEAFDDAISSLQGQQAAIGYLDSAAYLEWVLSLPQAAELEGVADLLDKVPAWTAGGLRIEPDALVASGVAPHPADAPDVLDARSLLPGLLPAGTVALAEVHEVGQAIVDGLAQGSGARAEEMRKQLEEALTPLGGLDALVGWIDEGGFVLLADDDTPLPGIVAVPSDAAAAEDLARSLGNLATLAGLAPTEETYAGQTITTVDVSKLADGVSVGGMPLRPSWVVTDDLVAVGLDSAFVKAVLDAPTTGTLADDERFDALLARAGKEHRALAFVDLDALEALIVADLEPAEQARFETEVQPYLAPLDALVGVAERDGSLDRTRALLVLDEEQ